MDAAAFEAMLRPFEELVFRHHRASGRRDTYENRRYDAFFLMLAFYAQLAQTAKGAKAPAGAETTGETPPAPAPDGEGDSADFAPVELLLAAIAGCSAIDVDYLTARRAEPDAFEVSASAAKLSDQHGNRLGEVTVDFRISFPSGEGGDAARARLVPAVTRSRDRLCTVSRTVQLPTRCAFSWTGPMRRTESARICLWMS